MCDNSIEFISSLGKECAVPGQSSSSGQLTSSVQSSSSVQQSSSSEKSDKAQHILSMEPDHTPEDPNVWAEIMKLPGTRRNNQIADGYVNWLNKNFDAGIHEVNIYLFTHAPE